MQERFRQIAAAKMRNERVNHTLQPTVLVDDAFMRLLSNRDMKWQNRRQFYCAAANVMRQILVDHARKKAAAKRGAGEPVVGLDAVAEPVSLSDPASLVAINDALDLLLREEPDAHQVFELKYFGNWTPKEIAENILDVSLSTVKRRYNTAKAFLLEQLNAY